MTDLRISGLALDRGIESISYARRDDTGAHLPDRQNLAPSDDGMRPQLESLLDKPGIDRTLDQALRPALSNRDLLMPARFGQALNDALASLSEAADQAAAQGDETARTLNRAVRLLREETGLRDLVAMYRNALHQG
ncbi:hypothetical protein CEG14_19780 [Bordetella genomosp. 1]|uniref:Type III secretion protein n=1 Tax=Bordetella genomosp. 1 TaxID=1395607 RepID=A0A261S815_9BORD|nr:hypothetical protein [Bordetella genomosp. 1]OZI33092.1 hypothetical protein CEG14_19780 [Bordetella genomosp. 1]OZI57197.1 hypothetical protein CAL27_23440 [Bordetella genomosp. 1]